jgi:tRNA nucleotidyltransferase (CCA-adding enzyme)
MDGPGVTSPPKGVQVRHARKVLEELVDPLVVERLRELGRMAREADMSAYLVGGMVRDLLLRSENLDVDVVVEGDGIGLARQAARKWNATLRIHQAFGTAKLIFPDGLDLDIATARTEYYHEPAALPSVEQSSLKLDLSRRDFTMNSLALRLEPDSFGEVIDFFGGFSDIKNRTIRILHNLSFVEDPTRIMRATRFSLRFGFELGSQTRKFLSASVRNGFLAQARGPRLLRELRMVLEECDPVEALETLEELGVLAAFHPKMHYRGKSLALTQAVVEVLAWFELLYHDREVKPWMLFIMALLAPLEAEEAKAWAREFGVADREGGDLIEAVGAARETLEKLTKVFFATDEPPQSKIHGACVETGTEALLFAMAATRDERKRRAISLYFTRLSSISTIVSGGDLKELGIPPGPVYRELLRGLLDHKLDTRITTRREELAWVADERKKRGI